jgi:hypothetical protein
MMDWTLVFVADMVVGLGARVKKWRKKEMVAVLGCFDGWRCVG